MRKISLLFIIFLFNFSFSQNKVTEDIKIKSFINVWGLLKYHHPVISQGKIDYNKEFLKEFERLETIVYQDKFNDEILNWVKSFDLEKTKYKTNSNPQNSKKLFIKNANYSWIENSNFSTELIEIINKIKNNVKIGNYYASINSMNKFIEFKNEKGINKFDLNKKSHRYLFLSSFWNAMRYWNVNIYLTDQPWSKVLNEMIPEFNTNDKIKFEFAKDKLFSKLNDSHSNYSSSYFLEKKLNHFPVFGGRIVNDSLVITKLYNKELAKKNSIDLGDVIYSVNGINLKDYYITKFSNHISSSNNNYLKSRIESYFLLASDIDSVQVSLKKRNGESRITNIKLYNQNRYSSELRLSLNQSKKENWYKLTDSIGYLNLGKINKPELKNAFKEFKNTKGVVIDLRNYPRNISVSEITEYLYPMKKIFVKALGPSKPSYGEYNIDAPLRLVKNPFSAGSNNKNHYKGKVVLLLNRKTSSHAEFIAMAIQQSPNCISIGEQTFGAVMNRIRFTLIDRTFIDFTGMGAFYPNDENVQRNGIKLDYYIKESAINYNPNLYIEEAIKIINF